MGGNGLVGRMRDMLDGLSGRNRINKFDFGILQTMMMVAALDGEVTAKELAEFEDLASQCRGFSEKSFKTVWDAALRSAGYIMLLARVESRENLVAAFVREAEKPFTSEVKLEGREDMMPVTSRVDISATLERNDSSTLFTSPSSTLTL